MLKQVVEGDVNMRERRTTGKLLLDPALRLMKPIPPAPARRPAASRATL